ncbi:helix-turn-helix domain-containing protein [Paeniglutamicibacter sp. ABSL32-1]|uniref:ArsR/SmtB family transcription factor n=1 Tax=Paeniglutamicibacter quisquiliarum TaxID=2849498 RepID=UPI001C2D39E8|nr:helix-turn-helix domain-containing protein [Paeniglutamicibacter quisquiliarum]
MEELLKALADPTRAVILDELVERTGQTLFEICNRLSSRHGINPSRQAISQHLAVLESAGLVRSERSGRFKFHYVDTAPLRRIAERWPEAGRQDTAASTAAPEAGRPSTANETEAMGGTAGPGAPRTGTSPSSEGKKP